MQPAVPRVLYIEDNNDSCEMIRELLRVSKVHCIFEVANSGDEAKAAIAKDGFDLFVVDVWLPDTDGYALTRDIRARDPKVPIIFYSTLNRDSDKQAAYAAGADTFLCKPDDIGALLDILRDFCKGKPVKGNAAEDHSSTRCGL